MRRGVVAGALGICVAAVLMPARGPVPDSLEGGRTGWTASAQARERCSDRSLAGRWALSFEGSLLGAIAGTAFTPGSVGVVAVLDSDGAGSFTGAGTFNVAGLSGNQSGTGTYVVNPDCSGTGTFDYGTWEMNVAFVISGEGAEREVRFVNTSQPAVLHGRIRRL